MAPFTLPASLPRPVLTRVVIADDHDLVRRLLRHAITDQPDLCVVGEASDGLQAVALSADLRPDAVVLDLGMPEMDGLEAAAAIRRILPGCRILVFSGHEATAAEELAFAAGADRFVAKHSGFQAVAMALAALMGR